MAVQVAATNSAEAKAVRERKSEITGLWNNLKVGGLRVCICVCVCGCVCVGVGVWVWVWV